jgi:hypothetical protein
MDIIIVISMAVYTWYIFMMSHEYSKTKYNYGKNERSLHENGRERNVRDGVWNPSSTSEDGYTLSKLHARKTNVQHINGHSMYWRWMRS